MTVESVEVKRYGPQHTGLLITIDGVEVKDKFVIPDPLPEGYPTKKAYVKDKARGMVAQHARRVASRANRAEWENTPTNQTADAAEILTELTT